MKRNVATILIVSVAVVAFVAMFSVRLWSSAPTVGTPTTTASTTLNVNTPTIVVITSVITDSSLIPGSVNLVRLDSNGLATGVAGVMRDDGQNGDRVAGDHIYSLQLNLNEPRQAAFEFEVSAAFKGLLWRVVSAPLQLAAVNPAGPSLIDFTKPNSVILLATVGAQLASLDNTGQIVTDVTLTISKILQGSVPSGTVIVRLPGGVLNGTRSFSPGTPFFTAGEEVVVILTGPDTQGIYSMPDLALDAYHIQTSATLGQVAVVDSAYDGIDGLQSPSADFSSFLQRSSAGQVPVAELYTRLGVSN